jgi:hypothetical protein
MHNAYKVMKYSIVMNNFKNLYPGGIRTHDLMVRRLLRKTLRHTAMVCQVNFIQVHLDVCTSGAKNRCLRNIRIIILHQNVSEVPTYAHV